MNTAMMSVVKSAFITAWEAIPFSIQFQQHWRLENGFLNPELMTTLAMGEVAKSLDPLTGELVIFLGTRLGTVKVYLSNIGVITDAPFVLRAMMTFGMLNTFNDLARFINPTTLMNNISLEVEERFTAINFMNSFQLLRAA